MRLAGIALLAFVAACVDGSSALTGGLDEADGGFSVDSGSPDGAGADAGEDADAGAPSCPPVTRDTEVDFELIPSLATHVELRVDGQPMERSPFHATLEPVGSTPLLAIELGLHTAGERFIAPGLWDLRVVGGDCTPTRPCGVFSERRRIEGGRLDVEITSHELTIRVALPERVDVTGDGPWPRLVIESLDPAQLPTERRITKRLSRTNPAEATLHVMPGRYQVTVFGSEGRSGFADAAGAVTTFDVESDRTVTIAAQPHTVGGTLSFPSSEIFERLRGELGVVVFDEGGRRLAHTAVNDRGEYNLSLYPGRYRLGTAIVDPTLGQLEHHLADGPLVEVGTESRRVDFEVDVDAYEVSLRGVGVTKPQARLELWRGTRRYGSVPAEGGTLWLSSGRYRATWSGFCPADLFVCVTFEIDPALEVSGGGPLRIDVGRRDVDVSLHMPPSAPDATGFINLANPGSVGGVGGPVSSEGRSGPFPVPARRFELLFSPQSVAFEPRHWIPLGVVDTSVGLDFQREVPAPVRFRGRLLVDGAPITTVSGGASLRVRVDPRVGFTAASLGEGTFELRTAPGDLELAYVPGGRCTGAACAPQRLPRCAP